MLFLYDFYDTLKQQQIFIFYIQFHTLTSLI